MAKLLREIERLRNELECYGRETRLDSRELLHLSEQLDRLINAYINQSRKPADMNRDEYSGMNTMGVQRVGGDERELQETEAGSGSCQARRLGEDT